MEEIIGVVRHADLVGGFELLDARRIEREHLNVDPGRIHFGYALVADTVQLLDNPRALAAALEKFVLEPTARTVEKSRAGEVLFNGNRSHTCALLCVLMVRDVWIWTARDAAPLQGSGV